MKYTIIEDCSPYYVRFKFEGLNDIVDFVKSISHKANTEFNEHYTQTTFNVTDAYAILEKLPMYNDFKWMDIRVSIFTVPPGNCSSIHKDGTNVKVGINIPLSILDDLCVTSWYDNKTFSGLEIDPKPYAKRILYTTFGYDHIPKVKQMVAREGEAILFNTNIYHSWENNKSKNIRQMLTFRIEPTTGVSFEDARKTLFG